MGVKLEHPNVRVDIVYVMTKRVMCEIAAMRNLGNLVGLLL